MLSQQIPPTVCMCVCVCNIYICGCGSQRSTFSVILRYYPPGNFFLEMEPLIWSFLIQSGWWARNTWSYTCLFLLALRLKACDTMSGIFLHAFWGSNQVLKQAWQALYQQSHLLRASQLCSSSIDEWKTLLYIKQKRLNRKEAFANPCGKYGEQGFKYVSI